MSQAPSLDQQRAQEITSVLTQSRAIITEEHFVLKSGRHADTYIDCDRLFVQPKSLLPIFDLWYHKWFSDRSSSQRPEVIAAPAVGGVYLVGGFAQFVAQHDQRSAQPGSTLPELRTVWAEKERDPRSNRETGKFVLERAGFAAAVRDRSVLVLEDVLTTGGSVMKTIDALRAAGGNIIGVAAIVSRSLSITAESIGVPRFTAGLQLDVPSYDFMALPDDLSDRPIVTNLAHGASFQAAHPMWPAGYKELVLDTE